MPPPFQPPKAATPIQRPGPPPPPPPLPIPFAQWAERVRGIMAGNCCLKAFCQGDFAPAANRDTGICQGVCVDWIRRKLFKQGAGFADSKRDAGGGGAVIPYGRQNFDQRMQKKGVRMAEVHPHVNHPSHSALEITTTLARSEHPKWGRFSEVSVAEVGQGPKPEVPRDSQSLSDGVRFAYGLAELITSTPAEAKVITPAMRLAIAEKDRAAMRGKPPPLPADFESRCFLVSLTGAGPASGEMGRLLGYCPVGHAIACEVSRRAGELRVYVMDPNLGEFGFDWPSGRHHLVDFLYVWWNLMRTSPSRQIYTKFVVDAYFL